MRQGESFVTLPLPALLPLPNVTRLAPVVQAISAHTIAGEVASRLLLTTGLAHLRNCICLFSRMLATTPKQMFACYSNQYRCLRFLAWLQLLPACHTLNPPLTKKAGCVPSAGVFDMMLAKNQRFKSASMAEYAESILRSAVRTIPLHQQ